MEMTYLPYPKHGRNDENETDQCETGFGMFNRPTRRMAKGDFRLSADFFIGSDRRF
jgi:hypothetical protein